MARSRLEKIGAIFDRVTGLLKSNAMKSEDKPIWYDVYKAFPPTREPRYNRPAPNINVRNIFYEEDVIRAEFHKNIKRLPAVNLANTSLPSITQQFLKNYYEIKETSVGEPKEAVFSKAFEKLKLERSTNIEARQRRETIKSEQTSQDKLPKQNFKDLFDDN